MKGPILRQAYNPCAWISLMNCTRLYLPLKSYYATQNPHMRERERDREREKEGGGLTNLTRLGLMKVPKHISLNDVQSSFLSFSYQRWPHLLQITISLLRYNLVCVCHHKLFFFLKNICVCCKFIWSN